MVIFSPLINELPTGPKESFAEKEARAKGKAVWTLPESHMENNLEEYASYNCSYSGGGGGESGGIC